MPHDVVVRADATRNAEAIIRAARAEMAASGIDVPMSAVAARAGVAVGTLYRHYPSKHDLVAALLAQSMHLVLERTEAAATRVEAGAPAADELVALVESVGMLYAADRAFKGAVGVAEIDALTRADPASPEGRSVAAVRRLLARAQADGAIRDDVGPRDLVLLLVGVPGPPADEAAQRTFLRVMTSGLRTH